MILIRLTTLTLLLTLALLVRQSPAPTIVAVAAPTPCAADDLALDCPPQLTAAELDAILASYGSPATGTGVAWVAQGREWGLNPEIALAFFVHESSAGTAPGWAGWKDGGGSTHNIGNVICTPGWECYGRFRDYPSWEAGIADWYRLIAVEYRDGRGHRSVEDVIPVYAPSIENDVAGYIGAVRGLVRGWRQP